VSGVRWATAVVLVAGLGSVAACATPKAPAAMPPIPKIEVTTDSSATAVPSDRPLPDDCVQVARAVDVDKVVGHDLDGDPDRILGVPEPAVGLTARLACYYGIPDGKPRDVAAVLIELATYVDPAAASERVRNIADAERQDGSQVGDQVVGKDHAALVTSKDQRMLLGTLGKTTYRLIIRNGVVPDDKVGQVLSDLAVLALTPK
jgi:hypothetical protein